MAAAASRGEKKLKNTAFTTMGLAGLVVADAAMEEKELKSIGFMTMGQAGPMAADTAMGEKELKLAEMVVHATVVPPPPLPPVSSRIDIDAASRKFLVDRCWPTGLINALISGLDRTTARFFICDDSESMMSSDGHWIVGEGASTK